MKKLFCIIVLLFASCVWSHDLFLVAHPFFLEKPGSIQLAMNLAEAFPGKEEPWRSDKTLRLWVMGAGMTHTLSSEKGKNPTIALPKEGTYVIGWNATSSYIEVDAKEFNEYIQAEGYANVIQTRKEQAMENLPGREKYTRFLKTFVQVGSKTTEDYGKTLGQKIEIVPQLNPYSLTAGSKLPVKLLFDGSPLASARVMATYDGYSQEHEAYAFTTDTDSDGMAMIPITNKGIWMVRANHMLPLKGDAKADWQSFWTNCSFEVK